MEPKEIRSCLMPSLLVVFTWQLEILVTTLMGTDTIVNACWALCANVLVRLF